MPSKRAVAAFEPISPDLDIRHLVESTPNFEYVTRIDCSMIEHHGLEAFERLVLLHVIVGGKPIVIEGYQQRLDRWTFALQWLRDNCSQKGTHNLFLPQERLLIKVAVENARDLSKKENLPLSIGHYLNSMPLLANQWTPQNYKNKDRQRIYLKDIDCPPLWQDKLTNLIPSCLFYLNESIGELDGPGAVDEPNPNGTGIRRGKGIAPAGDLMSSLPPEMRAENLMCYIGHEGTYTPSHREMCASLGQNIMVETSTGAVEDNKVSKPGSSIWFMTETKDRHVVSDYWLSALGHDIEVENHFAQINAWRAAPFKTWVVDQRVGDFILIPPLAPHQVWNRGTRTMKVAWNRTTVETLELALDEALPQARMVCRDEQYKNKAIIYYTLVKYTNLVASSTGLRQRSGKPPSKIKKLQKDFKRLHSLFTRILVSESFPPGQEEKKIEMVPFDSNITCAYCRGNIFNRFLTCPACVGELPNGGEDAYDICMDCYSMGRSCRCISKLRWVEQFPWGELVQKHEAWRRQIINFEGRVTDESPLSLKAEVERSGKRTLAEVCQGELRKRPWRDVRKPAEALDPGNESDEIVVNGERMVAKKKRKARKSEKFQRENQVCHFHAAWEPTWKQIECSKCKAIFCFGFLARAYDMKPQDLLADKAWKCPKCLNFCMCRNCQKRPDWKMVEPPRMMLGHDTKKVADPRSVESLVDYSLSNMSWLQKTGEDGRKNTRRIQKKQIAAEKAKAQGDQVHDSDNEDQQMQDSLLYLARQEGITIDPTLGGGSGAATKESTDSEDVYNENPEEGMPYDLYDDLEYPPQPQYVVPEGVIFDYPDPGVQPTIPPAVDSEPQKESHPGYEPANIRGKSPEIELTHLKRKRSAADTGDRAFNPKKSNPAPSSNKKKPRKSLVVKFSISREKLSKLNRMTLIAQSALKGIDIENEPPVIASDLRALNMESGILVLQRKKKALAGESKEDDDEEFAGPRFRKDRPQPTVSVSIPTRRTRTKTIAYDEASDVEMLEDAENTESPSSQDEAKPPEEETYVSSESAVEASSPVSGILDPALFEPSAPPSNEIRSFTSINQQRPPSSSKPNGASQPKKPVEPTKSILKKPAPVSEAEKNRKAKLAAMQGLDGSSDDFPSYSSSNEDYESEGWEEQQHVQAAPKTSPKIQKAQVQGIMRAPKAVERIARSASDSLMDDTESSRQPSPADGIRRQKSGMKPMTSV